MKLNTIGRDMGLRISLIILTGLSAVLLASAAQAQERPRQHGEVLDPGLATIVAGQLAGSDSCGNMTASDLSQLDCGIGYNVRGYPRGALETNNTVEELLFQEMARRSDVASKCQHDFLTASRANNYQAYQAEALAAFRNIQIPLKTALDQNDLLNSYNATSYADLTPDMRLKRAQLQPEGPAMRAAMNLLPKTIPMGNHPEIQQAIFEMAERGVSDSEFQRGYTAAIEKLRGKMSDSVDHYCKIRAVDGTYTVDHNLKVTYVTTGQSQALMTSLIVEPDVARRVNCRMVANYKNGETVKAVAVAAAEIAGTTALMYFVPPLGAAAAEAATASRSVAMARTLFFAAGAANYAVDGAVIASMAPRIAKECFQPTLMAAAGNASASCSEQVSQDGVMQEASAAKCAVNVGFAAVPILARFTKYIPRGLTSARAGSANATDVAVLDDIVVTAPRRPQVGASNTGVNDVQAARGARQTQISDESASPLRRPTHVNGAQVRTATSRSIAQLNKRNIGFEPSGRQTYLENAYTRRWWSFEHEPSSARGAGDFGSALRITRLPTRTARAHYSTPALEHPEMPAYLARIRAADADLVVDTSLPFTGAGAYYSPGSRVIGIGPGSSWKTFQHEFQHLEFDVFLRSRYPQMGATTLERQAELPPNVARLFTRRANEIYARGVRDGIPTNALNETLSVNRELELMGWRRYVPSKQFNETEQYAFRHQVTDLRALRARTPLTPAQAQALATAEQNLARSVARETSIPQVQLAAGATAAAVATAVAANAAFDIYEQVIYNEREKKMYAQRSDGNWVTVEP